MYIYMRIHICEYVCMYMYVYMYMYIYMYVFETHQIFRRPDHRGPSLTVLFVYDQTVLFVSDDCLICICV